MTLAATFSPAAPNLKGQLVFHPELGRHRLLVKFRAASAPSVDASGRLTLGNAPLAKAAAGLPEALTFRYAIEPAGPIAPAKAGAAGAGDAGDGRVLAEFAGLVYVEAPGAENDSLLRLGRALEALDAVEYATLEPLRGPPPPAAVDITPVTSLYSSQQNWQGAAPAGVDCRYAWTRGAKGRGVRLHDIEDSWGDLNHEDFDPDSLAYGRPRFSDTYQDHGIAVFGATFGQHNAYGIDGCAPEATGRAYSFQNQSGQQSRAATLVLMGEAAKAGDVILLEMQGGGLGGDDLAPADIDVAIWNATKAATDKGVVVIGTAGNGNANLDGAAYAAYRARGDNGVIMTGGGNSSTRARYVGSYGTCCVHVQGWGHNVTTSGYSDLFKPNSDFRQGYTRQFSGTSSAGAVMAALVVTLQSHALAALGRPLAPIEMRQILIATGTPQSGSTHIGPLPDLRKAILRVDSLAQSVAVAGSPRAGVGLLRGWSLGRDFLRVEAARGDYQLALRDASGRVWHRETLRSEGDAVERRLAPLPAGLYFLTLRAAGATIRGIPAAVSLR